MGRHPLVCQLMKGVYQLRPSQPRYGKTWEVGKQYNLMRLWDQMKNYALDSCHTNWLVG